MSPQNHIITIFTLKRKTCDMLQTFHPNALFLCPLIKSNNPRLSDVFRGYRNGALTRNDFLLDRPWFILIYIAQSILNWNLRPFSDYWLLNRFILSYCGYDQKQRFIWYGLVSLTSLHNENTDFAKVRYIILQKRSASELL